ARRVLFVPDFGSPIREHLIVVVRRLCGPAVSMGDPHGDLSLLVVGAQLPQRNRPVEQVGSVEITVGAAGVELVGLEPRAGPRPMRGRSPHCLDGPGRQCREIVVESPTAGCRSLIAPRHLPEGLPLVVDVVVSGEMWPRFQHYGLYSPLAQLR